MTRRPHEFLACAAVALATAGCQTTPEAKSLARKSSLGTAPITHVVLVQLKDPSRVDELVADCDRALPGIPGVVAYSCGVPLVTGRTNVTGDYEVGIYVGFRTEAEYRAYVDAPPHQALVERWRDGWKGVRIFDIVESQQDVAAPAAAPVPKSAAPAAGAKAPAASPAPAPAAPASTAPGTPAAPVTPAAAPAPASAPAPAANPATPPATLR